MNTEIIELQRQLTLLTRRVDELVKPEVGRWVDWTPTITQSGNVTFTKTFARCILKDSGQTVLLRARLTVTGTGTATNAIIIGGLPYAAANTSGIIGVMAIFDIGGAGIYYVGALYISGTILVGRAHGLANPFGVTPSFGLASGDIVDIVGTYEVA